jgi:Zn-dependent protease
MFFQLLFTSPIEFLSFAVALLVAITIHEAAHAWVANRLGDPTAREMGRVSLNPLDHLDPVGTILLLLAGFGWGKPVQINPHRLKNPIRDEILVALAGPVSNFLLAAIFAGIALLIGSHASPALTSLLEIISYFNIVLMLFNLIPIPPLDGSKILRLFLSDETYHWIEQYGFVVLLIIIFVPIFGFNLFDTLIHRPTLTLFSLLFGRSPF